MIWVNGGYSGELVWRTKWAFGRVIEIVKRTKLHEFEVLPKRWIVK